ncbi:MAG: hypothetical protein O9335_00675 [Inhella sp.]|jgi:hypothetical protein|uniref:hypothetical protein n=1 Tax=Inhella sp. TaxID=1921806 RepID=UPI0022C3DCB9|nr:hypothetical protein [Inhella sp.]MCZ8233647.1 hypothetical protein [Inhella sp.]
MTVPELAFPSDRRRFLSAADWLAGLVAAGVATAQSIAASASSPWPLKREVTVVTSGYRTH